MKVRDSGMPEVDYWESLFDVPHFLNEMQVLPGLGLLVEFGCGYGTFTLPAAGRVARVLGVDIEPDMITFTRQRAAAANVRNIQLEIRDIIEQGTGLPSESADYVMLFNILHHDRPEDLLQEAARILKPGGRAGLAHWRDDIVTPRGPEQSMRPSSEKMKQWALAAGFDPGESTLLLPWHQGLVARRNS